MPSALETMVKILKLERDQGGKDSAVVGGLGAYCRNWERDARTQARRPTHHILIDEIVDSLSQYQTIESDADRLVKLSYLLDRITNRVPAPKKYQQRIQEWEDKSRDQPDAKPSDAAVSERRREKPERRQERPSRSRRPGSQSQRHVIGDENSSLDRDYTSAPNREELDIEPLPRLSRPPQIERMQLELEEALDILSELEAPATSLKGIGAKQAELLKKLDLQSVGDLLYNFPRDYHDYTNFKCIRDLEVGDELPVIGTVTHANTAIGNNGRKDYLIRVADGSGTISARFFSQNYLSNSLKTRDVVVLSGKVSIFQNNLQMTNPEWEHLDSENLHTVGIVPVYRMTEGLSARLYRKHIKALSEAWSGKLPDPLPRSVLERAELAELRWALQQIHFPEGWDHLQHARRRLAFDDLIMLQLALLGKRREWQSTPGTPLEVADDAWDGFVKQVFPFELTEAQRNAVGEIRADMSRPIPMNRLLQGDVGSGKTAVAILALVIAQMNKRQAALMVPTGILAEQHYRNLTETFDNVPSESRPVVAQLTSAVAQSERESVYRGLADGSIDIVVGTHALIQEGVDFQDLGIVIIDEQHRFGVDQRANLRGKGRNPHLLVMSATPFPRTLALTVFADLDISVIDQMPPGRLPVLTKVIDPIARERLHGFVSAQLEAGRQAFFVHPLVEESDKIETASTVEAYERLRKVFYRHNVCLLHGQMSAAEKDDVMEAFSRGEHDVMVTTTVAEVGVDVPNASVMVIDGANRFGLAQLHQFRGRVGRGQHQSYCFLIPDQSASTDMDRFDEARAGELAEEDLDDSERRLLALERSTDGFELAEMDLKIRGAGDLLGRRQSGHIKLRMPSLFSPELLQIAQQEARTIYEEDPDLKLPEHQLLARHIRSDIAESADMS